MGGFRFWDAFQVKLVDLDLLGPSCSFAAVLYQPNLDQFIERHCRGLRVHVAKLSQRRCRWIGAAVFVGEVRQPEQDHFGGQIAGALFCGPCQCCEAHPAISRRQRVTAPDPAL